MNTVVFFHSHPMVWEVELKLAENQHVNRYVQIGIVSMLRIAVVGYGRVGKWVVRTAEKIPDVGIAGIVTRRPEEVSERTGHRVVPNIKGLEADVAVICTETETLFDLTPRILKSGYNTVDSFDLHPRALEYHRLIDGAAKKNMRVALYGIGWDPGLFSRARLLFEELIPEGKTRFDYGIDLPWGGVSRGHSTKLNQMPEVDLACSRTLPGSRPGKHRREVYIALKPGADEDSVARKIVSHPYFSRDETKLHFVDRREVEKLFTEEHSGLIVRTGRRKRGILERAEFKLILPSNPAFTARALIGGARACEKVLEKLGSGAYHMTEIPDVYFSSKSREEIIKRFL